MADNDNSPRLIQNARAGQRGQDSTEEGAPIPECGDIDPHLAGREEPICCPLESCNVNHLTPWGSGCAHDDLALFDFENPVGSPG